MKKRIILILLMSLFLFPFVTYAEEEITQSDENTITDTMELSSEPEVVEQEIQEEQEPVEEVEEIVVPEIVEKEQMIVNSPPTSGQVNIDGHLYYYDKNGNQVTGFVEENGKIYFYSRTYGYALQGWVRSVYEGTWYQQEDGSLLTGVQIIDGKKYCFGEDGKLITGFTTIDGKIYFFSRTYEYALTGWVRSVYEGTWYQQEDGSLLVGLQTIEDKNYYFGEDGKLVTGFTTINDKIYFFSRTYDYALQGWVSNFEGKWYQQEDGSLLMGLQTIEDKNYYFGEDGKLVTGFTTINDKIYFFSRTYDYALQGWVRSVYEGTWYQQEDGSLLIGLQTIDDKNYYFDEDGKLATGFITIDDKIYFFSRTYEYALTGWVSNLEGKWYQQEDGSLLTGIQEVDGKKYYFGEDGKLVFYDCEEAHAIYGWVSNEEGTWYQQEDGSLLTGVHIIEDKKYYLGEDGKRITGFTTIDGKIYFFSRTYGYALSGWVSNFEGTWYQLDDGSLLTGKQTIEGKNYYFGEDGKIKTGFFEEDGKIYFYSRVYNYALQGWVVSDTEGVWYQIEDGSLIQGAQTIEGRDYIFNNATGKLDGFQEINDQKYYYNPDGSQAKGIQYMTGRFWQFNSITGAFERFANRIRVIDISAHNGVIDWETVKASGIVDAVILRLGFGIGYMDSMFVRNKNELERLGIPYSIYLFSYAASGSEALRESNFVVDAIHDYDIHIATKYFGIYYDLEDWEIQKTGENSYGISKNTYRDMMVSFIDNIQRKLCIKVRVYASKNYIETRLPEDYRDYATWVAQWGPELTYTGPYEGWQYTSVGYVPGINGNVDMSYFYV